MDLHSPLTRELINKLMCGNFMTVNGNNLEEKDTGYLLAITYIQSQSSSINKVFYTAIGESIDVANGSDNTRIFRRNIMADLINSIKEAKKLNKPTATLFVTSRGGIKSHDFCMTVNTDIFDNDGIIKNGKKLNSTNCIIFDSSEAFLNFTEFENAREQLCETLQISVDEIKKCSFYNHKDIFDQVGSRCSDYAAEAYILLNDNNSEFKNINIEEINKNKFKFYLKISENMNNRYDTYIKMSADKVKLSNKRDDWDIQRNRDYKKQIEQDIYHINAKISEHKQLIRQNPLAGATIVNIQEGDVTGQRPRPITLHGEVKIKQPKRERSNCF